MQQVQGLVPFVNNLTFETSLIVRLWLIRKLPGVSFGAFGSNRASMCFF